MGLRHGGTDRADHALRLEGQIGRARSWASIRSMIQDAIRSRAVPGGNWGRRFTARERGTKGPNPPQLTCPFKKRLPPNGPRERKFAEFPKARAAALDVFLC